MTNCMAKSPNSVYAAQHGKRSMSRTATPIMVWVAVSSTSSTLSGVESQHLAKLRLTGIIHARRDGRRQIYTVDDPHVLTMVQQIFDHIAPDGTLAPDPPMPSR
jgi:hypothetical protein